MTIAAVVVTYNRFDLLKDLIESLRKQTKKLDGIVIVNNSSTDGTSEWLETQNDLIVVNQANLGSSGGQNTSMKTAYNLGFDYIWVMDDDILPDLNCLENLLLYLDGDNVLVPLRYHNNYDLFENEVITFNMKNPFKSIWKRVVTMADFQNGNIQIQGPTFEGPLFHRSVIDQIGFPEKDFFIYADDTEYFLRVLNNLTDVFLIPAAKIKRRIVPFPRQFEFNWKTYYMIRNIIAIDRLHGDFWIKNLRPFGYLFKWLMRCKNIDSINTTFRAFFDGWNYKSNT